MKIQCPACQTAFNVDEAKIPEKGVQSTCKNCSTRFLVTRAGAVAEKPDTAGGVDLAALESRLNPLIAADDQDAAAAVLLEMVQLCAKNCELEQAEALHARMYDQTPMALSAIIEAGEFIEKQKGEMIDEDHLERWEAIYSQLTPEETTTLSFAVQEITCGSEEMVFQQGDFDGHLYFVEEGRLKLGCADPDGEEDTEIMEVQAGDIFGADHFFGFTVCTYSAVAVEDSRLKRLDKSFRFKWLEELPGLESKMQSHCNTLLQASKLSVERNIERRSNTSRASDVRATIQMIDSDKMPEDWSRSVKISEISTGGACLELKLNRPEDAESLLAGILKISFTLHVSGVNRPAHITARVVAVNFLSFGDCAIHIQFMKELNEKVLALF